MNNNHSFIFAAIISASVSLVCFILSLAFYNAAYSDDILSAWQQQAAFQRANIAAVFSGSSLIASAVFALAAHLAKVNYAKTHGSSPRSGIQEISGEAQKPSVLNEFRSVLCVEEAEFTIQILEKSEDGKQINTIKELSVPSRDIEAAKQECESMARNTAKEVKLDTIRSRGVLFKDGWIVSEILDLYTMKWYPIETSTEPWRNLPKKLPNE